MNNLKMNTPSPEPVDPAIIRLNKNYNFDCHGVNDGSNNANIKRYTRSEIYLLRNDECSRKRPECALRAELQSLGVWKFHTGNGHQNSSNNATNNDSVTSNPPSSSGLVNTRTQRSPSTRGISSSDHLTASALPTSSNHSAPLHHIQIHKNFIDHRSISSSHLMPAFAKRRIAATSTTQNFGTSSNLTSYDGNSPSEPRPETPTDVKDLQTYAGRQRSKDHTLDYRQRGDDPKNFLSPQRKAICDQERERNDHERSCSASSPVSITNARHGHQVNLERRIGSGRLLPRDVNWDYHRGQDKDKNSVSLPIDKDMPVSNHLQSRNTGRYADRTQERSGGFIERRSFERKGGSEDNMRDKYENMNSSNTHGTRRFTSNETGSNAETSNHHQQQPTSHGRNRRNHQYNDRNEEPEWFSGGPTSQHDTIELRGFEEIDEHYSGISNKRNTSRKLRESSLSLRASGGNSSIAQTPSVQSKEQPPNNAKDLTAKSADVNTDNSTSAVNSDETISTTHIDNHVNLEEKTTSRTRNNNNSSENTKNDFDVIDKDPKSDNSALKSAAIQSEFNFDAFINLDPLDHTFMGSDSNIGTDAATTGSSRFSRWSFANKTSGDDLGVPDETDLQKLGASIIPNVEELEARMRKVDSNDAFNETSKIKGHETTMTSSSSEGYIQQPNQSLSQQPTQDTEAFKKLLEQLGSGNKQQQNARPFLLQPTNCSPTIPQMNIIKPVGIIPTGVPQLPLPPHATKNDEIKKFILQQQFIHQQQHQRQKQMQPAILQAPLLQQQQPLSPQIPQSVVNEVPTLLPSHMSMFFGHPQKHMEAQHLFQCVARGEISLSFLEQELNNSNTTQHAKEIIAAVLRENSRSVTPSAGLSVNVVPPQPNVNAVLHQHQILSPLVNSGPAEQQRTPSQPGHIATSLPSPRDLQFHTQAILQNAMLKKKLEDQQQQDALRRRQEMQKQQSGIIMSGSNEMDLSQKNLQQLQISTGIITMQPSHQQQSGPQQSHAPQHSLHQTRHVNSPTPLAFTPTSVLRKMTADKDNSNSQQQSGSTAQHLTQNKPLAQTGFVNQQVLQQPPQPRMILGGNHLQQHNNGGSQISPQTISQQPPPPLQQMRGASQVKWPAHMINQNMPVNKPMGRPILKGPLPPTLPTQQQQQKPQMTFASKLEFQQIQQQKLKNNQTSQHMLNQQQQSAQIFPHPMQQQQQPSQSNIITAHAQQQQHQQLFQHNQQRALALQRQQQQMQIQQQLHQHQPQQLDTANRLLGIPSANDTSSLATTNAASIINYQRDGGLSPTSNQLAQWFSPELLAQASAGKLPLLNMNQALSLEEFERSIQHSSTAVLN